MAEQNDKLSREELMTVYEQAGEGENELRNAARNGMGTFTSLLLAVLGGGLAGIRIIATDKVLLVSFTIIVGVLLIVLSRIAFTNYISDFCRQVEFMTIQGKIEDILGLTDERNYHASSYWKNEPIIPATFVGFRKEHAGCSKEFIDCLVKDKSKEIRWYYVTFAVIGVGFIVLGVLGGFGVIDFAQFV